MPAPPARSSIFPAGSLSPSSAKTLFTEWYDYTVALLGASGTAADARTALGAAADSAVVKLTGAQTVAGVKTFSSSPVLPGDATTALQAVPKQQLDDSVDPATLMPTVCVYLGEEATTSGTSHELLGIPSWALRVEVEGVGISISSPGSEPWGFQVGNSSSWSISGYSSGASKGTSTASSTAGFLAVYAPATPSLWTGKIVLTRAQASDTTWTCTSQFGRMDSAEVLSIATGQITITGLDRIRIAMLGGSSVFDAGYIRGKAGI